MVSLSDAELKLFIDSGLFDAAWYSKIYPDVALSGMPPLEHYLRFGVFLGRPPNGGAHITALANEHSRFCLEAYRLANSEVPKAPAAALVHRLLNRNREELITNWLDYQLDNLFGPTHRRRIACLLDLLFDGRNQESDASFRADKLARMVARLRSAIKQSNTPASKPTVSIIVPVYNQVFYTIACAISVFESAPQSSFELLVADDCSTDETAAAFAGFEPRIRVVNTTGNLGFLRNCNNAAARAAGEYIVLLNNDTVVCPGWLDEMISTFSSMPRCGIVGSKLLNPDGTLQEAGGIFWNDGSAWNYGRGSDPAKPEFNYVRPTDYCSGASICLRTSVWRGHGGFDEYYDRAYCEDSDLSFRFRRDSNLETYYQPFSVLIHHEGISSGKDITQGEKHYQYLNQRKFMQRWSPVLKKEHQLNGSNVFLARGRSSGKKTILVADNNIPQPDRDAGSRTVFQIIKLLVNKGVNVVFWPHNQWYDPKYTIWLQRLGVFVTYSSTDSPSFESWLDEHGRHISAVFLNRPHVALEMLPHVKEYTNARVFFYGHDIHHLRLAMEARQRPADRSVAAELDFYDEKERTLWEGLDVIYYPSPSEVEYVRRHLSLSKQDTKVRLLPVYAFDTFNDAAQANVTTREGIIFVAGFAHRPNVNGALWFAKNVWPALRGMHPNITFSCIGSNPPPELQSLRDVGIKVTGYVTDAELDAFYRKSRISIAPLLTGGGMKGKVAEALRAGLPVVTTDIGAQGFESCGSALDVCRNAEEMAAKISQLLTDDDLWIRRSKAGLQLAKQRFSTDAMWDVLRDVV